MKPKILIAYPNIPLMMTPSISIGLFTAILKQEGCDISLFETTGYSEDYGGMATERVKIGGTRAFDFKDLGVDIKNPADMLGDFRKQVISYKPDFILFHCVEDVFLQTCELLEYIQDLNIPHIVGGVFTTSAPDRAMRESVVKMIGVFEGERTVIEIINRIKTKSNFENIKGTWVKTKHGIQKNPPQPLVDISDLTPDYSLFDDVRFVRPYGGKIYKTFPVETYRGCPYKCTYCNSPFSRTFTKEHDLGNFLRRKSVERIRQELQEYMDKHQPTYFAFMDDSFLARPKKEIFDFCEMYEKHFKLPFWFNTRIENCRPEYLSALKAAGVHRMQFGLESGNEEYRKKVLFRDVPNKTYLEYFDYINDSDIAYVLNLIIGMPGETRELVFDTIRLVKAARGYDGLTVSAFQPYYGTVLRDLCLKHGWLDPEYINSATHGLNELSVLNMPEPFLQKQEIKRLADTINLYCFFDEKDWHEVEQAEFDLDKREELFKVYRKRFLGEFQMGGKTRIGKGATACRVDEKVLFSVLNTNPLREQEVVMLV